jgi:hypothetical protein
MNFPSQVRSVVLAGGPVGDLQLEPGDQPASKGLARVGGQPLAWRTFQALRESKSAASVVVVSPVAEAWPGAWAWVPAHDTLMGSFENGVNGCRTPSDPVLVCCGDMPFLTPEAVDDFVARCARRPEASIWYGFLRKENSVLRFPDLPHTWAKLQDGTFCGTGVMMLRPEVMPPVRAAMDNLTHARKNMFKLAGCLGWGALFAYAVGKLTVTKAEAAGRRIFGVPCAGVETPYAEMGFNVDDNASLALARRILQLEGDPYAASTRPLGTGA